MRFHLLISLGLRVVSLGRRASMIIMTDQIEAANAKTRHSNAWQLRSMSYCTTAVDLFFAASGVEINDEEGVAMIRLGLRCLNDIGAADRLMIAGYYQQAAVIIRDLIECSFLLDLFSRAPEHLRPWIELGEKAGLEGYRPKQVRDLLRELDGVDHTARDDLYRFYSREGTHPTAAGLVFTSPDGMTRRGPFDDPARMLGLTYELTRFSVMSAQHLCQWIVKLDLAEGPAYQALGKACEDITAAFMSLNDHLKKAHPE
jgi:hypothetical protein